jgi:hypothetical protein
MSYAVDIVLNVASVDIDVTAYVYIDLEDGSVDVVDKLVVWRSGEDITPLLRNEYVLKEVERLVAEALVEEALQDNI